VLKAAVAVCFASTLAGTAAAQQFQNQTATRFPTQAFYSNQLTIVDLDNDGDLDIVFADGQGYSSQGTALKPRIYINNGSGVFTDETDARAPGVTGWFRGVEAGDVDGDGWVDLVLAQDFNKQPKLLMNTGSGNFVDASGARLPAATLSSARAQFGDVDNDGDLDIILNHSGTVSRFGSGQPRIYLNNGSGFFSDVTATNYPAGNIAEQMDILFCDIDNDFDLDIFIGTRATSPNQSRFWKNNGSGVFALQAGFPNDASSYSVDVGDIDGDGDLDAISVNGGTNNAELLARNNNGLGSNWTNISSSITPNPTTDDNDSKFFDYDNDGDLDLIIGSLGASERVYANNGSGVFTQPAGIIPSVSDATLDIKVADLTGDGRLDFVTAQGESGAFQNKIFINVTGPIDTIAPKIVATEPIADGSPVGTPAPHVVRANIADSHTSDRGFHDKGVFLNYTIAGCPGGSGEVAMKWVGNNQWRGVLPAMPPGTSVTYWVTARDFANNLGTGASLTFVEAGPLANPGDANGDGFVNGGDLAVVLGNWLAGPEGDLDCSGTVDGGDLAVVLGNWTI